MQLMSKQRREALQRMDEKQTPFVPSRTQLIFKNTANLQLRGSTYDAKHLDKFLGSEFGDRSVNPERMARVEGAEVSDLEASVARNRSLH